MSGKASSAAERVLALLIVAVLAGVPVPGRAACDDSDVPQCSGHCPNASWWSKYKTWCEACGGKTYQDSRGGGCEPGPNWGGKNATAGTGSGSGNSALDQAYANAMSASQNASQMAQASALYLGGALLTEALRPATPEEQAAAQARREAEAEQARQRAAEEDRRSQALLNEMMDEDDGPGAVAPAAAGDSGELQLMLGDASDSRDFMPKRRPRKKRNPPPVAHKPAVPVAKQAPAGDGLQMDFGENFAANAGGRNRANRQPGREDDVVAPQRAFVQGRIDGQNCAQRGGAALCANVQGAMAATCRRDYDRGYDDGARLLAQDLGNRGRAAGLRDRPSGRNNALAYADARGSCGHTFTDAYNLAFGGH